MLRSRSPKRRSHPLIMVSFQTCLLAVFWLCLQITGVAGLALDEAYFPTPAGGSPELPPLVVVQANWPEDLVEVSGTKTGWIPVRLFGPAESERLDLSFVSRVPLTPEGTLAVPITLRMRGEDPVPLTNGSDPTHTVRRPATVVGEGAARRWWWEGFLAVALPAGTTEPGSIVVELTLTPSTGDPVRYRLVLGESWLVAGSALVGETLPDPNEPGKPVLIALENATRGSVALSATASAALPKTARPAPSAPAFAGLLARQLATRREAEHHGTRPACVYSWPVGRQLLSGWTGETTLGPAWEGLLQGEGSAPVFPGVRGVVWWHGEWEAEYGNFAATGQVAGQEHYQLDLVAFAQRYQAASVRLRSQVAARLARTGDAPGAEDHELSERLLWVVMQTPGVARRPEFFQEFNPLPAGAAPMDLQPLSAYGALRAAQFGTVRELRQAEPWHERPAALLLPLEPVASAPGWLWTTREASSRLRFQQSAELLLEALDARLRPSAVLPADRAKFADGWPQLAWNDNSVANPAHLLFPGALGLHLEAGPSPAGPWPEPVLECLVGNAWQKLPLPTGQADFTLPPGTLEVRYAWGDATRGRHFAQLGTVEAGPLLQQPLPAFHFTH